MIKGESYLYSLLLVWGTEFVFLKLSKKWAEMEHAEATEVTKTNYITSYIHQSIYISKHSIIS